MTIGEIIQAATSAITALAAIFAVTIAALGLRTWRRELHGKTEYGLARKVLLGVYRLRDTVDVFRSPLIHGWEMVPDGAEVPSMPPANGNAVALSRRWGRVAEAYSTLLVDLLEAEVTWGPKLAEVATQLSDCLHDLRSAADWLAELARSPDLDDVPEDRATLRATVFRTRDTNDEFGQRLSAVIASFSAALQPYVKR